MPRPGDIVAVTGGSGFIGRHLVRHLTDSGYRVRALTRRPPTQADDAEWVQGSLADSAKLDRLVGDASAVVHLAGAIKARDRAEFFHHNEGGTSAVVNAALRAAVPPAFVHVSSLAAREPHLSPYAASKRAAEQALQPLLGKTKTVVVRPPAVYGPGDLETLRIFKMAAAGWIVVPAAPGARFSLIHVSDFVASVTALLGQDAPGADPYEVADAEPDGHSWAAVAAAAGAAVGRPARLVQIPVPLIYLAGAAGAAASWLTGRPTMLTWSKVGEIVHPDWRARARPIPGFTPRWTLAEGFKDTVKWAISQGLLKSYS